MLTFFITHSQSEQADKVWRQSCVLLLPCILLAIMLCSLYLNEFKSVNVVLQTKFQLSQLKLGVVSAVMYYYFFLF